MPPGVDRNSEPGRDGRFGYLNCGFLYKVTFRAPAKRHGFSECFPTSAQWGWRGKIAHGSVVVPYPWDACFIPNGASDHESCMRRPVRTMGIPDQAEQCLLTKPSAHQALRHFPTARCTGRAVIDAAAAPAPSATEPHPRDQAGVVGNGWVVAGEGSIDGADRQLNDGRGRCRMKAIVVTDEAAGTAGMTLLDRPEPTAAINDVVVQVHASGFVPTEMEWTSTWTDPPTVTEHLRSPGTSWPEWSPLSGTARRDCRWDSGCSASRTGIATVPWRSTRQWRRATSAAPGRRRLHRRREPADLGTDRMAGAVRARPPSGGPERPRARRGRRSRVDGDSAGT